MKKIGIIGAGTMGSGIAQVSAQVGFEVLLFDTSFEAAKNALQKIAFLLSRKVEKGELTSVQVSTIVGLISPVNSITEFSTCDLII